MYLNAWMYGLIGAGAVIAAAGIILFMVQLTVLLRRRACLPVLPCTWTKTLEPVPLKDFSKSYGRTFTFKEVEDFCEGFINIIGESPCHQVYKGILHDGTEVAVKKMKKCATNNMEMERNFRFQVHLLSNLCHLHLANLIGFCDERNHRILVFQYAPNGSLFNNLYNDDEHLTWKQRMRVAVGSAAALAYLHHSCGPPIVHGDLTSHNVLLSEDYSAKVCGVGTLPQCSQLISIQKEMGFFDPYLGMQAAVSPSGDVYAFGVLLLELISGKSVFSKEFGMIVEWAGQFLQSQDQMTILTDPNLKNVPPLELYSVCEIARLCILKEALSRPRMNDVLYMLVQSLGIGPDSAPPCSNPEPSHPP